ncbi:hypothetical protein ABW19_dt0202969 [Dactylella cylindrospora]|nr:hypothetical protein ABW19_dt0202969 [Dactylella cylindrospora]
MVTAHLLNDPESLIGTYFHLPNYSNAAFALDTLKRVASLVKPIMRRHNFRIAKLAEFYPEMEPNLLGLNTSFPGSANLPIIQLRLRQPFDSSRFLDYENVVQTMLHELTHCVHGPHDDKFWKMFRSLQEELDTLRFSGYTGEGFMGQGQSLGAVPRGLSRHEAKKKAREAAERRRKGDQGRGRILGSGSLGPIRWTIEDVPGSTSYLIPRDAGWQVNNNTGRVSAPPTAPPRSPYATPNQTAAEAALKRQWEKEKKEKSGRLTKNRPSPPPYADSTGSCSGVRHSTAEEIEREIAQMHGFESVGEMESANERAIMQAAIELLEEADIEEDKLRAQDFEEQAGGASSSRGPVDFIDLTSSPSPPPQPPFSRTQSAPVNSHPTSVPILSPGWSCPVCTYVNEESHLQCSLCRVERNTHHLEDNETKAQIVALRDFERRNSTKPEPPNSSSSLNRGMGSDSKGKGKGVATYTPSSSSTSSGPTRRASGFSPTPKTEPAKPNRDTTFKINGQPAWKCQSCGWLVDQEWWSCGNCGTVKLQS